jgi:hypothetical protein
MGVDSASSVLQKSKVSEIAPPSLQGKQSEKGIRHEGAVRKKDLVLFRTKSFMAPLKDLNHRPTDISPIVIDFANTIHTITAGYLLTFILFY